MSKIYYQSQSRFYGWVGGRGGRCGGHSTRSTENSVLMNLSMKQKYRVECFTPMSSCHGI